MTKTEYDAKVTELKNAAGRLLGAIERQLEHDSPSDFVGGNKFDNGRLERVTGAIDDVLGWFDALQKGLDPGCEPRHYKFLHNKCD